MFMVGSLLLVELYGAHYVGALKPHWCIYWRVKHHFKNA